MHREEWIKNFKNEILRCHLTNDHKGFSQCVVDYQSILETVRVPQDLRNFVIDILLKRIFDPEILVHSEVYNLLNFLRNFLVCRKQKIDVDFDWRHVYNFIHSLFYSVEANNLYYVANFYGRENILETLG